MEASADVRNIASLEKIVEHCDHLDRAVRRFGDSIEALESDVDYRNSVAMSILQIGELTTHLTDAFLASHTSVPWKDIREMRNLAAHHYGSFSPSILWDTVKNDIAPLHDYCNQCVEELSKQLSASES